MAEDLKRVPNFTTSEINLLLEVVKKFKTIIESKKSDAVSWKGKEKAWVEITREFNARSGATSRGPKNLRCKYENLKKTAKKKFAAEKVERYKTGGGPFTPTEITTTDIEVKEMMDRVTVEGHCNNFDSDRPEVIEEIIVDNDHNYCDSEKAGSSFVNDLNSSLITVTATPSHEETDLNSSESDHAVNLAIITNKNITGSKKKTQKPASIQIVVRKFLPYLT